MWKIICALLLFQRALSAPSTRCTEICNSQNSQYFSNCCASPLVASSNNNKNWSDHKDFETHDGALVHTKEGEFAHGNTHGNFNEMSYYKEFNSGGDKHNFGNNQNFPNNLGISQKLEDLSTSSHNTFESMFQTRFSDFFKHFHESIKHLQELKSKDQLPVQDCEYPCVPINEQISQLQQEITTQQQRMEQMKQDFWSNWKNQNTVRETEHINPNQHLSQLNHHPGQVTKETNRYESYHNEKITTNPHITTTITKQPDKYIISPSQSQLSSQDHHSGSVSRYESSRNSQSRTQDQNNNYRQNSSPDQSPNASQDYYSGSISRQESSRNSASGTRGQTDYRRQNSSPDQSQNSSQDYYSGSVSRQESSRSQNSASGTQGQTDYHRQNSSPDQSPNSSQDYYSGSVSRQESSRSQNSVTQGQTDYNRQNSIYNSQNRVSQTGDHSSQYNQGIQSQAGYTEDNKNYEYQNRGKLPQRADQPSSQYKEEYGSSNQNQAGHTQGNNQQNMAYGYHASYGSKSYFSTHPQREYDQNSAYRTQQSGSQIDGSQTQTGYNPQSSVTVSHTSLNENGKLTHHLIQQSGSQGYGQQNSAYRTQQSGYQTDGSQTQTGVNPQSSRTVSHTSLTQNHGADFGSRTNGKLTHGLIQMGSAVDCNDEVSSAPYTRYKRNIYYPNRHHYHHHHNHHYHNQQQYPEDFSQQQLQDNFPQSNQQTEDFGEPTKIEKISQKELQELGQQIEDIRQGKVDTQDIYQDYSPEQRKTSEDLSQIIQQIPSHFKTQSQEADDEQIKDLPRRGFNQKTVGSLTLDQHAQDSFNFNQFPTTVLAPNSNPAGNQRFDGINHQQQIISTPRPAPKPTSRPRNTKPNPFFDNNVSTIKNSTENQVLIPPNKFGELKSDEEFFQIPQTDDKFSLVDKSENVSHHIMKPDEILQKHENTLKDISQQIVKEEPLQKRNNLFEILSQEGLKPNSHQKHENPLTETPFEISQDVLKPRENPYQKHENPFQDFSQQTLNPREETFHQQHVNSFQDFPQQYFNPHEESLNQQHVNPFEDFSQQILNPPQESFYQQHVNPSQDFSHQILNPPEESFHQQHVNSFDDFSQQLLKSREESFQNQKSPFEDFSQQIIQTSNEHSFPKNEKPLVNEKISNTNIMQNIEKPSVNFPHETVQKPLDDFSQHIQKSLEDILDSKGPKPFEDLSSQQIQITNGFISHVTPFENFSSQNQISRDDSLKNIPNSFDNDFQQNKNLSQEIENAFQQLSQHIQKVYQDLSQTSDDLTRNKDITQLPQSFQEQNKMTHHSNLDIDQQPQEISLGHQWHLFHNPGELTNEDLQLGRFLGTVQQTEKFDDTQVMEEIPISRKEKELTFDQQSEQLEPWKEKVNTFGKLEFGQSVQNEGNNPQIQSELPPLLNLQPRILQAYGGKGPYDPMHSEDIFSDVRQNPSATLLPVVIDDPWDIHEKPIVSFEPMINEDKVIPLDTVWIYPDAFPITPITEKPNPGFWDRVGRKFSSAVDKAKDKARGIFG
ncbi:uncharacterized protein LOC127277520 isoform X2 [Leptopilina boulardi]|uniref:uncharacterized protein LOC127277520 isoform X2 n=1 Tax=Leptopilina boulardi TaxID=63433 RepID=UPI0021F58729|nr:uncharacterized protein LOC127277520 isoform X2 [Leptopilina boulardi]